MVKFFKNKYNNLVVCGEADLGVVKDFLDIFKLQHVKFISESTLESVRKIEELEELVKPETNMVTDKEMVELKFLLKERGADDTLIDFITKG